MKKLDNHRQKDEIEPVFYTTYKINLKWVNNLNRRTDTVRLLEENTGGSLLHFGPGSDWNQAGNKIAGRNVNNLIHADDITLMAESEEELKSLLMRGKEESEKTGLKLNIQKTKIMASSPITSWQIDGEKVETDFILFI